MYKCLNRKKLIKLLICDITIITVAAVITFFGKTRWRAFENNNEREVVVPVIMYHSIVDDEKQVGDYCVNLNSVESDLRYLKENGYTSIFVEDLISYVYDNKELPEKPVIITADDGFYNNSFYLLPILEKYDMKATISIVGTYTEYIAVNDPHVPEYSYLTWDDINSMIESGRIEIANHTYNMHSSEQRKGCGINPTESEEEYAKMFTEDIGLMQSLIKINTGISSDVFTYPFGNISKESVPLLKEMGIKATLSCYERPNYISHNENCLYEIGRYNRNGKYTTEEFMRKLLSAN